MTITQAERDWLDALWRQAERDAGEPTAEDRLIATTWERYAYFRSIRFLPRA